VRPVIGNDVVDLTDPAIARHHENGRFVARVCGEEERARVVTARDLWSLFAAKEAAYKALVKVGGSPGFGHRALRIAPGLDSVSWQGWRLELEVTAEVDHVHAVAWMGGPRPIVRVERTTRGSAGSSEARVRTRNQGASAGSSEARVRTRNQGASAGSSEARVRTTDQDESDDARAVLRELVATAIGCRPAELAIVRDPSPGSWDGYGPPRVVRAGAPVEVDVSLSHDGGFVAAAALVGPGCRVGA
jgi:phosphopantetheinyl transferase (holo-ACP synthase)